MSNSPVKTMIACAAIVGATGYYFSLDEDAKISGMQALSSAVGRPAASPEVKGGAAEARPEARTRATQAARPQSASVVSIPRQQGQFFTQARVNSGSVRFLVDTGASAVALTLEDARRSGFDPHALDYDVPVDTANGRTYAARVRLDEVRIGGIRLDNIDFRLLEERFELIAGRQRLATGQFWLDLA